MTMDDEKPIGVETWGGEEHGAPDRHRAVLDDAAEARERGEREARERREREKGLRALGTPRRPRYTRLYSGGEIGLLQARCSVRTWGGEEHGAPDRDRAVLDEAAVGEFSRKILSLV